MFLNAPIDMRIIGILKWAGLIASGFAFPLMVASASGQACIGDCNDSGEVNVEEIVRGVNIALDAIPVAQCENLDRDANERVTVDELIGAINAALVGCRNEPPVLCPPGARTTSATVSFVNEIAPLFAANGCLSAACHGGAFPASGYDMRAYDTMFGPGSSARSFKLCEIVPGTPDASFLLEKLSTNPRFGQPMPLNRPPLTEEELALIRLWISEGAQTDATPTATRRPVTPTRTPTPAPSHTPTPRSTAAPTVPLPAICDAPGIICTIAGTGAAAFNGDGRPARDTSLYHPFDVLFDDLGRLIISDWNNLRIRRVDANGIVETIMGQNFEASPIEGGLAVDTPLHHPSDIARDTVGQLFVAGNHASVVFRVGTDDRIRIVAGEAEEPGYTGDGGPARDAKLDAPFGVLPTGDGGLYIADVAAHVVRYVDPAGIITTVAGTGPVPGTSAGGYAGDGGPATAAQLNGPTRMRLDGNGNLLVCDTNNSAIRRIDRVGIITTIAGTGTAGYTGDGGPAQQAALSNPYDLRVTPNGDIYVADSGNHVIRRIDRDGIITTVVGSGEPGFSGDQGLATSCQLDFPVALEFSADGDLWIADTFNQRVRRVSAVLLASVL